MFERLTTATVGDIVATDFRTAAVFERFGIDFCCGGRTSLADACRAAAVEPEAVIDALGTLPASSDGDDDVSAWPAERLIDHIVSIHHRYVRSALPQIDRHLAALEQAHGSRHPELARIRTCFEALTQELLQHMMKEEHVLFPYVRELAARGRACGWAPSPFGTVENPIRMMEREHRDAADRLQTIRRLTAGFSALPDGCTTYGVCMAELAEFERDLHRHVHLENNVLFPAAVRLESASGLRQ
jgi:regulator of cell morphogenesis and NO signaling